MFNLPFQISGDLNEFCNKDTLTFVTALNFHYYLFFSSFCKTAFSNFYFYFFIKQAFGYYLYAKIRILIVCVN